MKITRPLEDRLLFCLFLILVSYAFTEFLGKLPLRLWDESRQAANAMEMFSNHDWLVTYYEGKPDWWNTKPPLLIWLQVIAMHIFGISITSIRLVSAISGILTAAVLFNFIKKNTDNIWLAFFSGIVLTSMPGFNGYHAARTADYDALLTLFSLLSIIHFYYYVNTFSRKHIFLFFLFIGLGCLTKSISALLFLPGFCIYALAQKKAKLILKDPNVYIGACACIAIVALYYLTREHLTPGYLDAVYQNEIGGRYLEPNEGHKGSVFYYIRSMSSLQIYLWFYLFLITIIFLPLYFAILKDKKIIQYFSLLIICFLALLTSSETKIEWYVVPVLPMIAALCIMLLYAFITFITNQLNINRLELQKKIAHAVVLSLSLFSFVHILLLNYHPDDNEYEKRICQQSLFLQENTDAIKQLNLKAVDNDRHVLQTYYFHIKRLQVLNPAIGFADYKQLKKGDDAITSDKQINEYITKNYSVNEIYHQESIHIYSIK